MKVHLDALLHIRGCFGEEALDFIKRGLIMACVFMYVLEVGELLGGGLVDNPRSAHWVDVLKPFLKNSPGFLRGLFFDDGLVLVRDKFGYYA